MRGDPFCSGAFCGNSGETLTLVSFLTSVTNFANTAVAKRDHLASDPLGFFVLAMMAGAYVGLGILLIFSVLLISSIVTGQITMMFFIATL